MPALVLDQKGRFGLVKGSRMFRICGVISLLCCAVALGVIFWQLFPELYGKNVVPLHYNIHYGVDWTGAWWQIFHLPALGMSFVVVNTVMVFLLVRREPVLAQMVAIGTVVLSVFVLLATAFVVLLNLVYG